jgi:hypothetical protein
LILKFDLSLAMEINGSNTQVSLSFQKTSVGLEVAQEVSATLCQAIQFLLNIDRPMVNYRGSHQPSLEETTDQSLYNDFFAYRTGVFESAAREFWHQIFEGGESVQFPAIPSDNYCLHTADELHHDIQDVEWHESKYSAQVLIQAAWSIIAAHYVNSNQATFGMMNTEQQRERYGLPMPKVPVRVLIDQDDSIGEFLRNIDQQAVDIARFQRTGLHMIRLVSKEARQACGFKTLLVIESRGADDTESDSAPERTTTTSNNSDTTNTSSHKAFNFTEYALVIKCLITSHGTKLAINFDPGLFDKVQVRRIAYQLEHVLRQFSSKGNQLRQLRDVSIASPRDIQEIWRRNAVVPAPAELCVHDLIVARARSHPDAMAICA